MSDLDTADPPKLTFVLEHEGPIPLAEFTLALQRLAMRYSREVRASSPDDEPRLYIAEVRKGSVVVDFVARVTDATMWPIAAHVVAEGNALFTFGKNLKGVIDHFAGRKTLPLVTKADCDDARAIAGPVIHTLNAQVVMFFAGSEPVPLIEMDGPTARIVDNRAALERLALTEREANIHTNVLLVWDQVRDAPGVEAGRSPDRAIIQEIDPRPRQITFASDDIKDQMGRRDFNPFEKAFVVDAKVLVGPGGPVGYTILALHSVLDRE